MSGQNDESKPLLAQGGHEHPAAAAAKAEPAPPAAAAAADVKAAQVGASVPKKRPEKPDFGELGQLGEKYESEKAEAVLVNPPTIQQQFDSEVSAVTTSSAGAAAVHAGISPKRARRAPKAPRDKVAKLLAWDNTEPNQLWDLFEGNFVDHSIVDEGQFNLSDYGAVIFAKAEPNTEQAFVDMLHHWGGPTKLFIYSWCTLIPILVPLFMITKQNLSTEYRHGEAAVGLFRCVRLDRGTLRRAVCNATFPMPMLFPVVASCLALGFVSWRMVQQRVYYVFLRYKILIDLSQFKVHFTAFVRIVVLIMVGLVWLHFMFGFIYGYQRDVDPSRAKGDTRLLTVTVGEVLRDPLVLLNEEQGPLMEFIEDIWVDYLMPAIVAIAFILSATEADSSLIPLSKLCEAGANYVIRHLSGSIVCSGDVTRELLYGKPQLHKDASDNVEPLRRQLHHPPSEQDVKMVCKAFRKEALSFVGVSWAGGTEGDPEAAGLPTGRKHVPNASKRYHLWDLLFKPWWPLRIILAEDKSGFEPIQFRQVWGVHCILCSIVMAMNTYVVGYAFQWTLENTDKHKFCGVSTLLVYFSLLLPCGVIHVMSLIHLFSNITTAFS